jgi:dTMP kinase
MRSPSAPKHLIEGGLFIVHEGGEGAGKSTRARALKVRLEALGYDVLITREPGATELGTRLRKIALDPALAGAIVGMESLLIFAADEHAHVRQVIRPALAAGKIVICDRYIYSTKTYQLIEGVPADTIDLISALATGGLRPHRAYWFDVTPALGLSRLQAEKRTELTKYDQAPMAFHERVREEFRRQWEKLPHEITRIDADQADEEVANAAYADILELIESHAHPKPADKTARL